MTKRKVHSGPGNNRRHGGHRRPSNNSQSSNNQREAREPREPREQSTHSRPRNNDNYRGNRSFQPQSILPSPAILQEYEYATDGAASRIIEMAEIEQDRRNEWEAEYMRFYKKSLRLGQLFGFLLLISVVFAVMSLSTQGKDDVAMFLAGSAFFSVAIATIFSGGSARKNSRRTRRDRDRSRDKREKPHNEDESVD
jgi:uncharacterized membrane protein